MFYRQVFCSHSLTHKNKDVDGRGRGPALTEMNHFEASQPMRSPVTDLPPPFFWTLFQDFSAEGRTAPSSIR